MVFKFIKGGIKMKEIRVSEDVRIFEYEDGDVKIDKRHNDVDGYEIETIWLTKKETKKLKNNL